MTPDTLRKVGRALYGPRWQTELSLALGVNTRTVRSWLSGRLDIPDGVPAQLRSIVSAKQVELLEALELLE